MKFYKPRSTTNSFPLGSLCWGLWFFSSEEPVSAPYQPRLANTRLQTLQWTSVCWDFQCRDCSLGSSQERFLCVPPSSPSPPLSWCEMTVQKAGTAKMQQETWVTRVPTQQCSQNSSVPNCARKCHLFLRLKPPKPSACIGFSLALVRHWLKHVGDSKSLLASCTSLLSYIEYRDFYLTQRIWNCHCE